MAKPATVKIKLVSTADTGFYYVTKKNTRTSTDKLSFNLSNSADWALLGVTRGRCLGVGSLLGQAAGLGLLLQLLLQPCGHLFDGVRERLRNGDAYHRFRQHSDVYYLTGFVEPETTVVLRPGAVTAKDRAFLNALDASLTAQEREAYFSAYQSDPRDRATPLAMLDLLTRFHLGETLSEASTKLLRSMMTRARSRIALHLPPLSVANKTGTGTGTFNDVGIVTLPDGRHLVLVVFTRRAHGVTWEGSDELVADICRAGHPGDPPEPSDRRGMAGTGAALSLLAGQASNGPRSTVR